MSLLKAELYWAQDAKVQGRDVDELVAKLQSDTQRWLDISIDEILHDYVITMRLRSLVALAKG